MYTKYTSNVEKFRGYISTHRCDIDYSAQYITMEDVFIQIGKGKDDDPVYRLPGVKKVLLDSFMAAREGKFAWGKSNLDKDGNPTERSNKILNATPMGRFGEAEEINGTLLYLVNPKMSGFVTGVVVPIDGGFAAYSGV